MEPNGALERPRGELGSLSSPAADPVAERITAGGKQHAGPSSKSRVDPQTDGRPFAHPDLRGSPDDLDEMDEKSAAHL